MPGPSKKNAAFKVISGTARADRPAPVITELPTIDKVPDPPDWLPNSHSVKEWQRLAPVLVANRILTEAGLAAFGHLCALHGSLVQQWSAGLPPTGHMVSQYRALINDFGLTPVAQGKVRPIENLPEKGNPFERFKRRAKGSGPAPAA